jgi:hypothetical protein
MLTKTLARTNGAMLKMANRCFSSDTVTYDFKDLIRDPLQKDLPIYKLHHLQENEMPMKATTNKEELMAYF